MMFPSIKSIHTNGFDREMTHHRELKTEAMRIYGKPIIQTNAIKIGIANFKVVGRESTRQVT